MHSFHLLVVAAMFLSNSVTFIHERHVMQMDSRTCMTHPNEILDAATRLVVVNCPRMKRIP